MPEDLAMLGKLTQNIEANIIKLPNISASIPQLNQAIAELQSKGYQIPSFPENPKSKAEEEIRARYAKVLGSAVNPVLREGNSDRRVAAPVKENAKRNPPPVKMRPWSKDCKTHVAHMKHGDFFVSERSISMEKADTVTIELVGSDGSTKVMKKGLKLEEGEVIDASVMSRKALRTYFKDQIKEATQTGMMLSLHLKATMMKISDPIIFGHAVTVFYEKVFTKYAGVFKQNGINPNNGLGDVLRKVENIQNKSLSAAILSDFEKCRKEQADWAMVDSAKGITNLHVPNDVIIDASMPPLIRDGGKMWNSENGLSETKVLIPDRSYASIYQAIIDNCREYGQFDHTTTGSVANVGLMAKKAEEYGSHDKTFEIPRAGKMRVLGSDGKVIFEHDVEKGDIWRMCQTKDEAIRDWIKLAVHRARASGSPAIFWLDKARSHDLVLIGKINEYLKDYDTKGLDLSIERPEDAMKMTCKIVRAGKDVISVTGNVLRDYLTDLFPILELGTSAKMLSIVPLLKGGGLFETGAGGSAPKHVEQFLKEGHLRWDSLGEYLAVAVSLEHMAHASNKKEAQLLSDTLNAAVGRLLETGKSPSRKVREIDNRGSTFYVAKYWAEELSKTDSKFNALKDALDKNEETIVNELIQCQGTPVDIGGYYLPDDAKANSAMRPSQLFNDVLSNGYSSKL